MPHKKVLKTIPGDEKSGKMPVNVVTHSYDYPMGEMGKMGKKMKKMPAMRPEMSPTFLTAGKRKPGKDG